MTVPPLVKRYLVREPVTGVLIKYTRYASGNCTKKTMITGDKAIAIPVNELENALKNMEVLQCY